MRDLSPAAVMAQVAEALPLEARKNVIIVGSLAAGYFYFSSDGARAIRTKDVDCLFSPHAAAVTVAADVTDQLLGAKWQLKPGEWGKPGTKDDAEEKLPMVRLLPPDAAANDWFLELLSAPPRFDPAMPSKKLRRVETSAGHFAICSFDYLALAEWEPLPTKHAVRIARPEMMALANLLHHPRIADTLIAGTDYKRSNKDLGRVLALAYLTIERDRRDGSDELGMWAERMWAALQAKFNGQAQSLALQAGSGIRALLSSPGDRDQALRIANLGLLATMDVGREAFDATGARFLAEVIDELEEMARSAAVTGQ